MQLTFSKKGFNDFSASGPGGDPLSQFNLSKFGASFGDNNPEMGGGMDVQMLSQQDKEDNENEICAKCHQKDKDHGEMWI